MSYIGHTMYNFVFGRIEKFRKIITYQLNQLTNNNGVLDQLLAKAVSLLNVYILQSHPKNDVSFAS